MTMERTLILLKPDAVQRGLVGDVLGRFEKKGLKIAGMKLMQITPELAAKHYEQHKERPFYQGLVNFMTSSPVVALALEGIGAIAVCRKIMGATFGSDAEAGTIRGDYCIDVGRNICHGSDAVDSANKEIALWFTPEELCDWQSHSEPWIYE